MNKELMKKAGFGKEVNLVEKGFCPFCQVSLSTVEFRDEISRRENKISGLCQKCQDEMFREE